MVCNDCGKEEEKIIDGICKSCKIRKTRLKEKYIPFKELPEKEKQKIIKARNISSRYYKENIKQENEDENLINIDINLDELKEDVYNNIKIAFEKLNLDEQIDIENNYEDLKLVTKAIKLLKTKHLEKDDYTKQKEIIKKKVEVLDKYIIDVLHNLEHIDVDDTEKQLQEVKKLAIIRKIRREFKNSEEILKHYQTLYNILDNSNQKLPNVLKDIDMFITAVEKKLYNKMVEEPKSDRKLLGIHKWHVTCDIVSNTTERKVIKINETFDGRDQDDVKTRVMHSLKSRYGDSVIWSKMNIVKIR